MAEAYLKTKIMGFDFHKKDAQARGQKGEGAKKMQCWMILMASELALIKKPTKKRLDKKQH